MISMISNVVNVVRYCLVLERYFPDTNLRVHASTFSTIYVTSEG